MPIGHRSSAVAVSVTHNGAAQFLSLGGLRMSMQIIANNGANRILEHDRILKRLLAQRAHEWQRQTGFRRLMTRIKIEFWAWCETSLEQRRILRSGSSY
jgi:hypothetical protein